MAKTPHQPRWRIGVDTGGTFCDLVLVDPEGGVRATTKRLSTPDDPGRAVLEGIDRLLARFDGVQSAAEGERARPLNVDDIDQVIHGSTVATNALLENRTDRAAFVTTAGFEDLLLLARQNRPGLYALAPRRPEPPIPRPLCIGVDERLGYDGRVIAPLTQHEIDRVIDALIERRVESVAICLLHSYANDAHEARLAEAMRDRLSEVHLTVSSELLPELREYERAATCAANALVGPTMSRYIGKLDAALGRGRLRIMASGGGTLPPRAVIERPIETVTSGPAGGVIGAWAMAQRAGESRIIGLDMGGTSTDVALCDRGPTHTTETTINALPIRLPAIDLHTVGAGGGSIAWIDDGGALRVGPQSAGADPGPACYGRQGETPSMATVTDAHAVLGHLRPDRALGDAISVDADAARAALGAIATRLGRSIDDTAEGVLRIADAAMARAVQRVSVQRGRDARGYTLVAFGGAGGLHACRLAERLGMTRVLVPVYDGLLSACGMLAAPPRYAYSQAVLRTYPCGAAKYPDPFADAAVRAALDALRARAQAALDADGVAPASRTFRVSLDLRFAGQSHEITVACDDEAPAIDRFLETHRRLYGYAPTGRPIELVAARIEALGPTPTLSPGPLGSVRHAASLPAGYRHRDALAVGASLAGPVVIEAYAATTVVPEGWSVRVLSDGQMMLEYKEKRDV